MTDVLADNGEPGTLGDVLDGATDLVESAALYELCDPGPEAALGDLEQAAGLVVTSPIAIVKAASPW